MTRVYVELVFFDNFLMDFMLLYFTARLSDKRVRFPRLFTGAAIGALYAAAVPVLPFLKHMLCRLVFSLLMCLPLGPVFHKPFLKRIGFFYGVTFIFGGAIYFFAYWLGGEVRDGILINFPIVRYILLGGVISSIIIEIFLRIQYPSSDKYYRLCGMVSGNFFTLTAFLDTGNKLTDTGGGGVIIADKKAVLNQLSPELRRKLCTLECPDVPIRQFCFSTLSGKGEMLAFLPDQLVLSDGTNIYAAKAYLALSDARFSSKADAVLSQNIRLFHIKKEAPREQATAIHHLENTSSSISTPESLLHKRQSGTTASPQQK